MLNLIHSFMHWQAHLSWSEASFMVVCVLLTVVCIGIYFDKVSS